jgi:hypothetical protein
VGTSFLSIISILIVLTYGFLFGIKYCAYYFGKIMESHWVGTFVGGLLSCLCLIGYGYYLWYFCIPLGVMAVTSYFFLYTFLAIVLHTGINIMPVIRAISNSVFKYTDLLDKDTIDTCKDPNAINWTFNSTIFSINWWISRPSSLMRWSKKVVLYGFAFLFEIIINEEIIY